MPFIIQGPIIDRNTNQPLPSAEIKASFSYVAGNAPQIDAIDNIEQAGDEEGKLSLNVMKASLAG